MTQVQNTGLMRALNEHLRVSKQIVQRVARIAQSVEQRIENPRVGSSILSPGTTYYEKLALKNVGFFYALLEMTFRHTQRYSIIPSQFQACCA